MVYRKIEYGMFKADIKKLIRKRLKYKERIYYHKNKIILYEGKVKEIEKAIDTLEELARGKHKV